MKPHAHPCRTIEVTPVLPPAHGQTVCPPPHGSGAMSGLAGILVLLVTAVAPVQAQEAVEASDLDWVPWERLTAEQQAMVGDNCCGLYIEPAAPASAGEAADTVINATTLEGEVDGIVRITDGLEVAQQGARISARAGSFDYRARRLTLEDEVRIRQPGVLLTGSSATVDQLAGTSDIREASYLLHDSGVRGSAEIIVYTDADGIITIDNGLFTRCEPGDNGWIIEGRSIELDRSDGRGVATDLTLRVRDVPVLNLPRITFPIDDRRVTGFLAPVIGSTRDGGLDLAAPYYLNLAPNYDMTLTPRLQFKRGVMLGVEGRHLGRRHQQQANLTFLPDD
ncbi:MAG: LPS-assembly protein LptD, partial [Pseudohongiellaceae bacterium]